MASTMAATTATAAQRRKPAARPAVWKPSRWIWVPFIWLCITSTRTISTWMTWSGRGLLTGADVAGSPVDQIVMTALMLLAIYVLKERWPKTRAILANNKWIVALFALMAISVVWSNFPGITFRRCSRSMGSLLMALVVLTEVNPAEAVRIMLRWLYFFFIPLSVFTIKWYRGIGVMWNWNGSEEEWTGLSVDKNSLGQVSMCSGAFWLWQLFRDLSEAKRRGKYKKIALDIALLLMTLWLIRGSKTVHSSTAIVGFGMCAAVLVGLQLMKKQTGRARRIVAGTMLGIILLTPLVYLVFEVMDVAPVELVVEATGRNMTFTDRTFLWADVLNNAKKHPILGVGMGAFWVGALGYEMYPLPNWTLKTPEWRPEEGHNGYIDVYVELGMVGETVLAFVILSALWGSFRDLETDFEYGSLRLVYLLGIIVNNITETSYLKGTHDFWFLFILFAINLPQPRKQRVRKKVASKWWTENPENKPGASDGDLQFCGETAMA
jgi:exopolysaccharide production protein ExoQ